MHTAGSLHLGNVIAIWSATFKIFTHNKFLMA